MREQRGLRLGGAVVLLGTLALIESHLALLPPSGGFLLFLFFWPLLFFSAGFAQRVSWISIAAAGALGGSGLLAERATAHWFAAIAAGMLSALWLLDRALDPILHRAASTGFAHTLAGKRGNAILSVPVAAVMYGVGLDGYSGGQPVLLGCGAIYFFAAAVFRRRPELSRLLGSRWRVRLGIILALSILLAVAHQRLSLRAAALGAIQSWRRLLYCAGYAFLGSRWCSAMYGWAAGATGKELDQELSAR